MLEVRIPARWAIDEVIVETSGLAQPASDRYPRAASPSHMILVLAALVVGRSGIRFLPIIERGG